MRCVGYKLLHGWKFSRMAITFVVFLGVDQSITQIFIVCGHSTRNFDDLLKLNTENYKANQFKVSGFKGNLIY